MKIGKHRAATGKMLKFVHKLERSQLIQKVILGKAQGCFHKMSEGTFKIRKSIDVGLQMTYYSKEGVRDVYITFPKEKKDEVIKYLDTL